MMKKIAKSSRRARKTGNLEDKRLRVHYNRTRKCLSVLHKVGGKWPVLAHVDRILLSNVTFVMKENAFKRIHAHKKKKRQVCALVEGQSIPLVPEAFIKDPIEVRFSIDDYPFFYRISDGTPIHKARYCLIDKTRIYVQEEAVAQD